MKLLELIWILFIQGVTSLRIVNFDVPRHAIEGDDVRLRCDYDLEGETLYSVKWYWNGREFYRYIPTDDPTTTVFSSPELRIQEKKSKENDVFISKVNTNSTGIFRCEVSAEAPVFQTASAEDIFIVVILPDQPGPVIAGSKPKYSLGDNLLVSCSASNSFPATNLTWFINGNHADPAYIEVDEHLKTSDGKFTARSYLRLHINDHHTKLGKIKLKCGASIPSVYWKSVEVSIEINQTEDIIEQDEITIKDEKSWSFFKGGGQTIQSSSWTLIWLLTSYVIIY